MVTTFGSLLAPQIPLSVFRDNVITVSCNGSLDEKKMVEELVKLGYENVYQVEAPGQFSIRGGIIDIFDLTPDRVVGR